MRRINMRSERSDMMLFLLKVLVGADAYGIFVETFQSWSKEKRTIILPSEKTIQKNKKQQGVAEALLVKKNKAKSYEEMTWEEVAKKAETISWIKTSAEDARRISKKIEIENRAWREMNVGTLFHSMDVGRENYLRKLKKQIIDKIEKEDKEKALIKEDKSA